MIPRYLTCSTLVSLFPKDGFRLRDFTAWDAIKYWGIKLSNSKRPGSFGTNSNLNWTSLKMFNISFESTSSLMLGYRSTAKLPMEFLVNPLLPFKNYYVLIRITVP